MFLDFVSICQTNLHFAHVHTHTHTHTEEKLVVYSAEQSCPELVLHPFFHS